MIRTQLKFFELEVVICNENSHCLKCQQIKDCSSKKVNDLEGLALKITQNEFRKGKK